MGSWVEGLSFSEIGNQLAAVSHNCILNVFDIENETNYKENVLEN
jgi:hypothetical protein